MKETEIKITVKEYINISEIDEADRQLIEQARMAAGHAYVPYSGFSVGAAVLLANGEVITGSNQENASYPAGICAERVAIFHANSKFPDVPVIALSVSASSGESNTAEPVSPCGICRQVLLETEKRTGSPIRIILSGAEKIRIINGASSLLPLSFDRTILKY
jgi:cytidine deaminase